MSTQRTGPSRASRRPPSEVSDHVPLQTGCARPLQAQALLLLLAELSCWALAWTSLEPFAPPSPSFGSRLGMETAGPAPLSRQQKVAAMLSSAPLAVLLISCRD